MLIKHFLLTGYWICMFSSWIQDVRVCDTHSGSRDPNLSLSLSLSLAPSFWRSRSFCSHTERYFGLCFSQSRRVSQACLCSDSFVKLTANAMRAVRLSFFSSIHLMRENQTVGREIMWIKVIVTLLTYFLTTTNLVSHLRRALMAANSCSFSAWQVPRYCHAYSLMKCTCHYNCLLWGGKHEF